MKIPSRKAAVALWLGALLSSGVQAADWDHDANIAAGVHELVATYRLAGGDGMARLVGGCYDLIAERPDHDERLRQLEYCAGMDFAAVRIAATDDKVGRGEADFFGVPQVVARVGRLQQFLTDPNVGNQVIRAWSIASGEALSREGF